jgi:hypothetical protein
VQHIDWCLGPCQTPQSPVANPRPTEWSAGPTDRAGLLSGCRPTERIGEATDCAGLLSGYLMQCPYRPPVVVLVAVVALVVKADA